MKLITMSVRVIYNKRLAGASDVLLQFTFINKTVLMELKLYAFSFNKSLLHFHFTQIVSNIS